MSETETRQQQIERLRGERERWMRAYYAHAPAMSVPNQTAVDCKQRAGILSSEITRLQRDGAL